MRGFITASTDPTAPARFSATAWAVVAILIALILIPSLFLPLGPDESLFLVSSRKLLAGAIHYRDIIDVKPPLIYYLYALGGLIFGTGEFSVRLFDALLQGLTCLLMIRFVRRASGSDMTAAIAPILYLLLYIGQGYGAVGQCESYAGLFGIGALHLLFFRRTPLGLLVAGALTAMLALVKFTLGIMLPAAILIEIVLFNDGWRRSIRNVLFILAGFVAVASLLPLYLITTGAVENFLLVQEFVRGYTRLESSSAGAWLKSFLHYMPRHFSDNYPLLLTIATAGGIGLSMLRTDGNDEERDGRGRMLRACAIVFFALLATVILEGKFYHYHFSRIYAFGAILAGSGITAATGWMLRSDAPRRYARAIASAGAIALLLYGPFFRYGWQCAPMALWATRGPEGVDRFYDRIGPYYPRTELKEIGAYLSDRRPEDRIFPASSVGALICYFAGYVPDFGIYHSPFYIAEFTPPELRLATTRYLLEERPRFIVMQHGDTTFDLTGSRATSAEALRKLPGIDSLLQSEYRVTKRTGYFEVYERRE